MSGLGFRRDLQDRGPDGPTQGLNKAVNQRRHLNTTRLRDALTAKQRRSDTALSIWLQRHGSDGRLMEEIARRLVVDVAAARLLVR